MSTGRVNDKVYIEVEHVAILLASLEQTPKPLPVKLLLKLAL